MLSLKTLVVSVKVILKFDDIPTVVVLEFLEAEFTVKVAAVESPVIPEVCFIIRFPLLS